MGMVRSPEGTLVTSQSPRAPIGFQRRHWSSSSSQIVFTGFRRGPRPMRHPWKKPCHIKGFSPLRGVEDLGIHSEPCVILYWLELSACAQLILYGGGCCDPTQHPTEARGNLQRRCPRLQPPH